MEFKNSYRTVRCCVGYHVCKLISKECICIIQITFWLTFGQNDFVDETQIAAGKDKMERKDGQIFELISSSLSSTSKEHKRRTWSSISYSLSLAFSITSPCRVNAIISMCTKLRDSQCDYFYWSIGKVYSPLWPNHQRRYSQFRPLDLLHRF